jgi:hypothetical protein
LTLWRWSDTNQISRQKTVPPCGAYLADSSL